MACDQKHVTKSGKRGADWLQLVVKREEGAWAGRRGAMAWPMALLGNTMAHGGQASVEAHKGGTTGNSLTKNGASGWLCRRPALPSAVGSIGIEPTADGPWRRLSGAQLGPWAQATGGGPAAAMVSTQGTLGSTFRPWPPTFWPIAIPILMTEESNRLIDSVYVA